MIKIEVKKYIYKILEKFLIVNKFDKQINKIKNWFFYSWLNFEKLKCTKNIYFYSFRIDIYYRAYLRKENDTFIVFDVNNHDYEKIKKKLKSM